MKTNSATYAGDRRRRPRILTKKNSLRAAVAALAIFTTVSIMSEFRGPREGEMGRLYRNRPRVAELQPPAPKVVVKEAAPPVADNDFADPLTLEAMKREQLLGVGADPLDPRQGAQIGSEYMESYVPAQPLALDAGENRGKARFSIEGGAAGVYTRLDQ